MSRKGRKRKEEAMQPPNLLRPQSPHKIHPLVPTFCHCGQIRNRTCFSLTNAQDMKVESSASHGTYHDCFIRSNALQHGTKVATLPPYSWSKSHLLFSARRQNVIDSLTFKFLPTTILLTAKDSLNCYETSTYIQSQL